jgi:DNA helicase-2/ATP-dependent DNA helicase PcrA
MEQALPEGALEPPRPARKQPADSPASGSSSGRFPAASPAGGSLFGNRTSDLSGTPARKTGSAPVPDVAPGSRVLHKVFGLGTAVSVTGTGANAIAEIAFDSGAIKKIAVGYGSLSIPEEGK